MVKEYFRHDYYARSDIKLNCLKMKYGMAGLGIYWCLIEKLYESDGYLSMDFDSIAFELNSDIQMIEKVIVGCKLFKFNKNKTKFYSESVLRRLKARNERSEKARESINKRWENIRT